MTELWILVLQTILWLQTITFLLPIRKICLKLIQYCIGSLDYCCCCSVIDFAILYVLAKSELKDASLLRDNIYVSDKITSPAAYGVFRPKIVVPKGYELRNLHYIVAHESAHIYRKDNLWRIIAVISASVHWFNL